MNVSSWDTTVAIEGPLRQCASQCYNQGNEKDTPYPSCLRPHEWRHSQIQNGGRLCLISWHRCHSSTERTSRSCFGHHAKHVALMIPWALLLWYEGGDETPRPSVLNRERPIRMRVKIRLETYRGVQFVVPHIKIVHDIQRVAHTDAKVIDAQIGPDTIHTLRTTVIYTPP